MLEWEFKTCRSRSAILFGKTMRRLNQTNQTYSFESTKISIWFGACKMRRLNQFLQYRNNLHIARVSPLRFVSFGFISQDGIIVKKVLICCAINNNSFFSFSFSLVEIKHLNYSGTLISPTYHFWWRGQLHPFGGKDMPF